MQQAHRVRQCRHRIFPQHFARQQLLQSAPSKQVERTPGEIAPGQLVHPLGGRVDRRQRLLDTGRFTLVDPLHLGMHQLVAVGPIAHLAKTAQPAAAQHVGLLRSTEMEEPQRDAAGAVGQPHQQRAAAAEPDVGQLHLALDHRLIASTKTADRNDTGTVLVADWQMKQQVLDTVDTELVQALGTLRADALQRGDGGVSETRGRGGHRGSIRKVGQCNKHGDRPSDQCTSPPRSFTNRRNSTLSRSSSRPAAIS